MPNNMKERHNIFFATEIFYNYNSNKKQLKIVATTEDRTPRDVELLH